MSKNQCDQWRYVFKLTAYLRSNHEQPLFIIRRPCSLVEPDAIIDYVFDCLLRELKVMQVKRDDCVFFFNLYNVETKKNVMNEIFYGNSTKIISLTC